MKKTKMIIIALVVLAYIILPDPLPGPIDDALVAIMGYYFARK